MSKAALDVRVRQDSGKKKANLSLIRRNAVKILRQLKVSRGQLSVLLVGDRRIRTINKQYLNHDTATDVIAFGQYDGKSVRAESGPVPQLGDIVISVDTAARAAGEYGNTFLYELHFYLCHGILHILGWDDRTKKQREAMFRKQEKTLKAVRVYNKR